MRKILPITLTLLMVLLAGTAMADRNPRVERRLDARGDRIEHRFEHKAVQAAAHGKYRQAKHFRNQGAKINRHLDRKGDRRHSRYDHRDNYRHQHRVIRTTPVVVYPAPYHRHRDNFVSVRIQQPGFLFGWSSLH